MKRRMVYLVYFVVFVSSLSFYNAYADSLSFDQSPIVDKHSGIITLSLTTPSSDLTKFVDVTPQGGSLQPITVYGRGSGPTFSFYDSHFVEFTSGTPATSLFVIVNTPLPRTVTASFQGTTSSASVISSATSNPFPAVSKYSLTQVANCTDFNGDTDGDGICNKWEDQTLFTPPCSTLLPNGGICIPFPNSSIPYTYACDPTCPNPNKADVFFEIDWMEGHKPSTQALNDVKSAFETSNYNSTNNVMGIQFHYQLSDGNIRHYDSILNPGSSRNPGFDQVKKDNYGSNISTERGDTTNWLNSLKPAKMQVFHYVLFGHSQPGLVSGSSEMPGNDVFVTLGTFDGKVGNLDQQEGTLLHEIGHNMGINHGGSDNVNCKPDYVSVMSYSRQFKDLVSNRPLDFSKKKLNDLSESAPSTTPNLDPYHTQEQVVFGDNNGLIHFANTGDQNIPWGSANTNLNFISSAGCPQDAIMTLSSNLDWDGTKLKLTSKSDGNWLDGRSSDPKGVGIQFENSTVEQQQTGGVYKYDELTAQDVKNMRIDRWQILCPELPPTLDQPGQQNNVLPDQARKQVCDQVDRIIEDIKHDDMEQALIHAYELETSIDERLIPDQATRSNIHSKITDIIDSQSVAVPEFPVSALLILTIVIISIIGISKSGFNLTKFT